MTVGYYAQDQAQTLDESRTVRRRDAGPRPDGWGEEPVRGLLARFLFRSDDVTSSSARSLAARRAG